MKTLTTKFIIEYGGDIIESDEYDYEYFEEGEQVYYRTGYEEENYKDVLEEMEIDKIAWVFNTISIRHEIISNE